MNVEGLGGTDIDNHREFQNSPAVGGLAIEFYRRISRHYGKGGAFDAMLSAGEKQLALWRFEPHVAEKVILDWLHEHRVDIVTGAVLAEGAAGVVKEGSGLLSISTSKGDFQGRVFIDAIIEGDILASAASGSAFQRRPDARAGEGSAKPSQASEGVMPLTSSHIWLEGSRRGATPRCCLARMTLVTCSHDGPCRKDPPLAQV